VTEYSSPVWQSSAHTNLVDVEFNSAICFIAGTVCLISLFWVLVLANIELTAEINKATERLVNQVEFILTGCFMMTSHILLRDI